MYVCMFVTSTGNQDFIAKEVVVTLPEAPNSTSCTAVTITSDRVTEQVEEFSVELLIPPGQSNIQPGPITEAVIIIEDPG